jgi:hypothetical protein
MKHLLERPLLSPAPAGPVRAGILAGRRRRSGETGRPAREGNLFHTWEKNFLSCLCKNFPIFALCGPKLQSAFTANGAARPQSPAFRHKHEEWNYTFSQKRTFFSHGSLSPCWKGRQGRSGRPRGGPGRGQPAPLRQTRPDCYKSPKGERIFVTGHRRAGLLACPALPGRIGRFHPPDSVSNGSVPNLRLKTGGAPVLPARIRCMGRNEEGRMAM